MYQTDHCIKKKKKKKRKDSGERWGERELWMNRGAMSHPPTPMAAMKHTDEEIGHRRRAKLSLTPAWRGWLSSSYNTAGKQNTNRTRIRHTRSVFGHCVTVADTSWGFCLIRGINVRARGPLLHNIKDTAEEGLHSDKQLAE